MTSETAGSLVPSQAERLKIFLHALLFVLGFSLVFVIGWGGSAMALGLERASDWLKRMRPYQKYFKIASGGFMIAIGLLSFLSPCVLPLVPAYPGCLSGQAVNGGA